MNNRRFRVYGSLVRAKGRGGEQNLVATTYWVDTTEADALRETYTATRPVLAILMVDNYEDGNTVLLRAGDIHRHPAGAGNFDGRHLRRPEEGLRGSPAQRGAGPGG